MLGFKIVVIVVSEKYRFDIEHYVLLDYCISSRKVVSVELCVLCGVAGLRP